MKRGWSILLSELVDAVDVGHGDAADFQIVCEICREPVFKTERSASHFLSHYPSAARWSPDCELRVARAIRENDDRTLPSQDRGQSLDHYLSIFETMATSLLTGMIDLPVVRRRMRSPDFLPSRLLATSSFRECIASDGLDMIVAENWTGRKEPGTLAHQFQEEFGNRFPSTLQKKVQIDRARDMAEALCRGPQARNLALLTGFSFVAAMLATRSYDPLEGLITDRIMFGDRNQARDAIQKLRDKETLERLLQISNIHAIHFLTLLDYIGFIPSSDGSMPKRTDVRFGSVNDERRTGHPMMTKEA